MKAWTRLTQESIACLRTLTPSKRRMILTHTSRTWTLSTFQLLARLKADDGAGDLALVTRFADKLPIGFLVFVWDRNDWKQLIWSIRPLIVETIALPRPTPPQCAPKSNGLKRSWKDGGSLSRHRGLSGPHHGKEEAMDRLDQIAATAQICAEILGNVETGDFALMPLTGESLTRPYLERVFWSPRRLRICGVIGLVNGSQCTVLSEPLEDEDIRGLEELFAEYCESITGRVEGTSAAASATQADDSIGWCERLHWLPDTRD